MKEQAFYACSTPRLQTHPCLEAVLSARAGFQVEVSRCRASNTSIAMASNPKQASSQAERILQKGHRNIPCKSNVLDLADVAAARQRSALYSELGMALLVGRRIHLDTWIPVSMSLLYSAMFVRSISSPGMLRAACSHQHRCPSGGDHPTDVTSVANGGRSATSDLEVAADVRTRIASVPDILNKTV